ncbi:fibrinogen C domain-containing protein 1-like [Branchiostoma floridae x Branchiostoma belcheri]
MQTLQGRPRDCSDLLKEGYDSSGIYTIYPFSNDVQLSGKSVGVFCDMETDSGGWTVFQRRQDGSEDFYRGWADYKAGFGKLDGEFWLGNNNLHQLTSQAQYELWVDLEDFEGNSAYAQYQVFAVGSEADYYRLTVGSYNGTAGDSLTAHHSGRPFSTWDRDHDASPTSCAQAYTGAWWYAACHDANLNGLYLAGAQVSNGGNGVNWLTWKGYYYSLKHTEMKIRPIHVGMVAQESQVSSLQNTVEQLQNMVSSQQFQLHNQMQLIQTLQGRPRDCSDLLKEGYDSSGIYTIYPYFNDVQESGKSIGVFCDMGTDEGGWTVFQRRQDGSEDFYRGWADYKAGFGKLDGEFWLGNDKLHQLTSQAQYELRVDLEDFEGNSAYAQYQVFTVGSEAGHYILTVEGYNGTAGNSMDSSHNGFPFSTKDRDYDGSSGSCAQAYKGAWWYAACHHSNLNGLYHGGSHTSYADGVNWSAWKGHYYSLKHTEMKIRPIAN